MKQSITTKFQIYITGSIILAAIIVFIIVRGVIKKEYTHHFTQEIETAELVLDNYLEGRFALLKSGIDILLSDPRFLASISEWDPQTAQQEVSNFRQVVKADLFIIADTAGNILAEDNRNHPTTINTAELTASEYDNDYHKSFNLIGGGVYQMLSSPIRFTSGQNIGKVFVGYRLDEGELHKFKKLAGSEIILSAKGTVLATTNSKIDIGAGIDGIHLSESELLSGKVHTQEQDGQDHLLLLHLLDKPDNVAITLARSLDAQLDPAMSKISLYLILLTIAASIISLLAIYSYTSKNLKGAVNRLVDAAGKISSGQLDVPITPLNDDELGYLATCYDRMRLTLIQNRESLAKAQEERINAERLATIGQLAAGIIHDFKSPMTAIALAVEAIINGLGDPPKREGYCRTIKNQVNRMVNMTQDLLDYAHGNKSLHLEELEFTEMISNQVEFHRERFNKQKIGLEHRLPKPFIVSIDPHKFRRVLDNLLNNAFEALSPSNKVCVEVTANAQVFQVQVSDDGPGIPQDIINDIFKPFVTKGKSSGTGLGLAISQKIIADHGGELSVTSEPGRGACFTIQLPTTLIGSQNVPSKTDKRTVAV